MNRRGFFVWLVRLHPPPGRVFAREMVEFMEARHARAVREGRRGRFWIELCVDLVVTLVGGWFEYLSAGVGRMGVTEWPRVAWHESGLRFLKRRKTASALVVGTVALALGAANIAFGVLDALLLSSFGIPDPDRVVVVTPSRELAGIGMVPFNDAYPNYRLLRETARSFETLAAMTQATFSWDDGQEARALSGARVTSSFFATTGVAPMLGRGFVPEEEGPSAAPLVIISHALWQSAFAGDPRVTGRSMLLDGVPHEIVGVMPPGFARPLPSEIWVPFDLQPAHWERILAARSITVYGRLLPGVSMSEADEEMRAFTARALEASVDNQGFTYGLLKLREQELPQGERAVVLIQTGSLLLLLLAVLNLSVVLVAWGVERRQEMAVRLALGAGGGRIALGLLFQGMILVLAASLGGLLIATLALPSVRGLDVPPVLAPYMATIGLNGRVFGFGVAMALLAGVAAATGPAWLGRRMAIGDSLRSGSRNSGLSPAAMRLQKTMLALQATFAVVLLAGAATLGLSFRNLASVSTGFESEGRLVARVQLPSPGYTTAESRAQFGQLIDEALRQQPELARAGYTTTLPMGDGNSVSRFVATPEEADPAMDPPASNVRRVSNGYFDAMGVPLVAGRAFGPADEASSAPVAIVSQTAAARFWPGADPIGRPLYRAVPGSPPQRLQVVGVVGDLVEIGFDRPPAQTIYLPWAQNSVQRVSFVFEPRPGAGDGGAAFRRALRSAAPGVAAGPIIPMVSIERQTNMIAWLQSTLVSAFAVMALCIALLGTYGVMSQVVSSRQRDHAVRLALGSMPSAIATSIVRSAMAVAVPGVGVGLGLSWIAFQLLLRPLLFGVDQSPPLLWIGVGAGMLLLVLVATLPPAVRAARVRVGPSIGSS